MTRAKTAFANRLAASPLQHQIVSPSAYFSDMAQVIEMAQRGRVYLTNRNARVNPIHAADLSSACMDRLEAGTAGAWDIGGPEVLTWQRIADLAFAVSGRRPRVTAIPQSLPRAVLQLARFSRSRRADALGFALWAMSHDAVGEPTGTHRLEDFFRQEIQRRR